MGSARMLTVLLATCLVLATAGGCSGGSGSSTTDPTTTTTAPTSTTTPTTTEPRRRAESDLIELAQAVTLAEDDFGDEWSVESPGGENPLDPESCSRRPDGPEDGMRLGAAQDGPRMQLGDEPATVGSTGYAFRRERSAVQWIETVRSEEWAECTRDRLAGEPEAEGLEIELDSRQIDRLGENGFEAFAQFYGRDADGNVDLVVNVMHYRAGGVILEDTLRRRADMDPEDWSAVDRAHAAAVAASWERVNELR